MEFSGGGPTVELTPEREVNCLQEGRLTGFVVSYNDV